VVGAAGTATFTANIASLGLTLTPTVHLGNSLPAPPPPLATFTTVSQGTQIAFAKPFEDWQYHSYAYSAAVQNAISEAIGVDVQDVLLGVPLPGSNNGTKLPFKIVSAFVEPTTSDYVVDDKIPIAFKALFNHTCLDAAEELIRNNNTLAGCICDNNSATAQNLDHYHCNGVPQYNYPTGAVINNGFVTAKFDPAGPKLIGLLHRYGLSVNNAYYYDKVCLCGFVFLEC
jgi:hypothetical protein